MTFQTRTQEAVNIFDFLPAQEQSTEAKVMPFNPTTGNQYGGGNIMLLEIEAAARGFTQMQFAGFGQWIKSGRAVKKGETGIRIKACGQFEKLDKVTGKMETKTFMNEKVVFAIEQTEILKA